jgi:hypothetical protein
VLPLQPLFRRQTKGAPDPAAAEDDVPRPVPAPADTDDRVPSGCRTIRAANAITGTDADELLAPSWLWLFFGHVVTSKK